MKPGYWVRWFTSHWSVEPCVGLWQTALFGSHQCLPPQWADAPGNSNSQLLLIPDVNAAAGLNFFFAQTWDDLESLSWTSACDCDLDFDWGQLAASWRGDLVPAKRSHLVSAAADQCCCCCCCWCCCWWCGGTMASADTTAVSTMACWPLSCPTTACVTSTVLSACAQSPKN